MIRIIAAAVLALTAAGPALAQSSSEGQILCQQDLKELQERFEQQQASLSAAEQQNIREQLRVANTQCQSSPELAETTIDDLREDLQMEEDAPQSGGASGGGASD